jgi:hypothetical protein
MTLVIIYKPAHPDQLFQVQYDGKRTVFLMEQVTNKQGAYGDNNSLSY